MAKKHKLHEEDTPWWEKGLDNYTPREPLTQAERDQSPKRKTQKPKSKEREIITPLSVNKDNPFSPYESVTESSWEKLGKYAEDALSDQEWARSMRRASKKLDKADREVVKGILNNRIDKRERGLDKYTDVYRKKIDSELGESNGVTEGNRRNRPDYVSMIDKYNQRARSSKALADKLRGAAELSDDEAERTKLNRKADWRDKESAGLNRIVDKGMGKYAKIKAGELIQSMNDSRIEELSDEAEAWIDAAGRAQTHGYDDPEYKKLMKKADGKSETDESAVNELSPETYAQVAKRANRRRADTHANIEKDVRKDGYAIVDPEVMDRTRRDARAERRATHSLAKIADKDLIDRINAQGPSKELALQMYHGWNAPYKANRDMDKRVDTRIKSAHAGTNAPTASDTRKAKDVVNSQMNRMQAKARTAADNAGKTQVINRPINPRIVQKKKGFGDWAKSAAKKFGLGKLVGESTNLRDVVAKFEGEAEANKAAEILTNSGIPARVSTKADFAIGGEDGGEWGILVAAGDVRRAGAILGRTNDTDVEFDPYTHID